MGFEVEEQATYLNVGQVTFETSDGMKFPEDIAFEQQLAQVANLANPTANVSPVFGSVAPGATTLTQQAQMSLDA